MAVEIEPVAILVVVPPSLFSLVVPAVVPAAVTAAIARILSTVVATVLSAVVTIGVSEPAVITVAGDLTVFQVGTATSDLIRPVVVLLRLVLFDKFAKDLLKALSGHLGFVDRPD